LTTVGEAIAAPLAVCFDLPTRRDCSTVEGGEAAAPEEFLGVGATGEEVGPVAVRREEMPAQADGSWVVAVPRRGWIRISRPAGTAALGVEVYAASDEEFRQPVWGGQPGGG
jgi:hypothetical protein